MALLLTGAGFSRPFGGYLSSQMWALILCQPQVRSSDRLRKAMLRDTNFEQVYSEVVTSSEYGGEEKHGFTEAVWKAYKQMHEEMCTQSNADRAHSLMSRFVHRFANREHSEPALVFTLNQDLLVESFNTPDLRLLQPGVPSHQPDGQSISLPGTAAVEEAAKTYRQAGSPAINYFKLHGSFNWLRHDGSRGLAIGTHKGTLLSEEPLLKWYQKVFEDGLHEPEQSLLVIGYSFRDPHINGTILNAVKAVGLKLFVMSPETPETFGDNVCETRRSARKHQIGIEGQGDEIWKALHGYYCGSVDDYYTSNHVKLPPKGQALFRDLGLG